MEATEASLELMRRYGACARAVGLGATESPRVGGGSDGCTSSAMGIPSIDALGPRGKGFHTKDEFIEAETLVQRAQALAMHLLGGP
jgi:glutamate carboxypeptidase